MNRAILWSWCAVPALMLTACGGGAPSGPSGEISQSQAAGFKSTGGETTLAMSDSSDPGAIGGSLAGAGYSGRSVSALLNNALRNVGGQGRTSCNIVKGSETNADSDLVRDNSTDTYDCDFTGDSSFTLTLEGNTKVKDDLVNATTGMFPLGGATVTPALTLNITGTGDGGAFSGTIVTAGLWNFLLGTTSATGKLELTQTYNFSAAGQSVNGNIGFYIDPWTVTPTNLAQPFQAGAVSWKSYFVYELRDVAYTLEGTTKDLVYDRNCGMARTNPAKYNGGSISWIDGASNTIKVSFAADCASTWTYNDTAL